MVSGEQHSLGEGDLSRLVTGSKWRLAGPWCPGVSVLLILCSCPLCIVPWPPPATPSTGMPFSERNSSRSTYCNTRQQVSSFSFRLRSPSRERFVMLTTKERGEKLIVNCFQLLTSLNDRDLRSFFLRENWLTRQLLCEMKFIHQLIIIMV